MARCCLLEFKRKQGMWEVAKLPYVSEDDVIWGTRVIRDIC